MRRVVLDTSIIVAGLRSRLGASFGLLQCVARGRLIPLATPTLFLEYEDVLKRPEQQRATGLDRDDVDSFLEALAAAIEPVETHILWRPQLRDADDEMVLETAINGQADALVTLNIKDFRDAGPRFGIRILRPGQLLAEMSE